MLRILEGTPVSLEELLQEALLYLKAGSLSCLRELLLRPETSSIPLSAGTMVLVSITYNNAMLVSEIPRRIPGH